MAQVKICLFGWMRVLVDGEEWKWERRKTQALISYLATSSQPYHRDTLATLLWAESDTANARAALRRVLVEINQSPLSNWLIANRQSIQLKPDDGLLIDVQQFENLVKRTGEAEALHQAVELYTASFLAGFSLNDAPDFDDWQSIQSQRYSQLAESALETLAQLQVKNQQYDAALNTLKQLRALNPLHEPAVQHLMEVYEKMSLRHAAIVLYESFEQVLMTELGVKPSARLVTYYQNLHTESGTYSPISPTHILPHAPELVIGREQVIQDVKSHLGTPGARMILQGWPGIGKTTITAVIAHDPELHHIFADGILWASLDESPNLTTILREWCSASGLDVSDHQTPDVLASRLRTQLHDKRVLLIVDDVWQAEHAQLLLAGGQECSVLITTRFNDIARQLMLTPDNLYKVPILTREQSLDLFRRLAPQVLMAHQAAVTQLMDDVEGLPLAIKVVGLMLHAEQSMGWSVEDLLRDLRDSTALLGAQAPADRMDIATQTTPTITALLQRSVQRLSPEMQERFAVLGVFAPKPATFDEGAITAVWDVKDIRQAIRVLVDRGLIEPIGGGRFQMHALLVMLARSMVEGGL